MALKLAVITAGAVGAYFGGKLAQAGAEIRFLARGPHLQALQERGLKVKSSAGDFEVAPSTYFASSDAAEVVRGADLVFFAVKSFDTEEVARALAPGLGPEAVVISLQNGVENETLLSGILGPERVAAGSAYIEVTLDEPGAIKHTRMGRIAVAANTEAGTPVPFASELRDLSEKAGFSCEIAPDALTLKWSKLIFISAFSGWTTVTRCTIDKVIANPELDEAFRSTLLETATVAKAAGARINSEEALNNVLNMVQRLGDMDSSMHYDLEQGKRIEVEALNGAVVRKGRELGIPTPYNQALLAILSTYNAEK
jgi:2-dehydropantoate 2-reductase